MRSFAYTSDNISLGTDHSTLTASCQKKDNTKQDSTLDLNTCVGNMDGQLQWGHQDFERTSSNITLEVVSATSKVILHATCTKADGITPNDSTLDLGEHIENQDGTLVYVP